MISLVVEARPRASEVTVSDDELIVLLGEGEGIRWPDIDEDLSVAGLLAGTPSRR